MRLILVTGEFEVVDDYGNPTGRTEVLVDYAINSDTLETVVVPNVPPSELGAKYDHDIGEWAIDGKR